MNNTEAMKISEKVVNSVTEQPEAGQHIAELVNSDVKTMLKINGAWHQVDDDSKADEAENSLFFVTAKISKGKQAGIPVSLAVPNTLLPKVKKGIYISFTTTAKGFSQVSSNTLTTKQANAIINEVVE